MNSMDWLVLLQVFIYGGILHLLLAAMLATLNLVFSPGFFEENNPAKLFAILVTEAHREKNNRLGTHYISRGKVALEQASNVFMPPYLSANEKVRQVLSMMRHAIFTRRSIVVYQGFFLSPVKTLRESLLFSYRKFRILRKLYRISMGCMADEIPQSNPSLRRRIKYFNTWLPEFLKKLSFGSFSYFLREYVNAISTYDQDRHFHLHFDCFIHGLLPLNPQTDKGFLAKHYKEEKYEKSHLIGLFSLALIECFSNIGEDFEKIQDSLGSLDHVDFKQAMFTLFEERENDLLNRFAYFICGLQLLPRFVSVDLLALDPKILASLEKFLDTFGELIARPDLEKKYLVKWELQDFYEGCFDSPISEDI